MRSRCIKTVSTEHAIDSVQTSPLQPKPKRRVLRRILDCINGIGAEYAKFQEFGSCVFEQIDLPRIRSQRLGPVISGIRQLLTVSSPNLLVDVDSSHDEMIVRVATFIDVPT